MRIEILIGNSEEPLIYPLNKPKLTVGSADTCDIVVNAPNVSRKHVQIATEGDSFYVIDQGSTNGTFINEERLVPGRRTEFTSFFPVRLGDSVLITLLSDEEAQADEPPLLSFPDADKTPAPSARGSDESTKMISLRDLNKAKTSDLVSRRQEIIKKKTTTSTSKGSAKSGKPKSKRAQDKSRMHKIQFFVVVLVSIAAYLNFYVFVPEKEVKVAKIGEEIPLDKNKVEAARPKPPEVVYVVPENELPSREKVENLLGDLKCTIEIEKYFCDKVYKGNELPFGSVQVGSTIFILADGEFFYNEAKKFLPLPKSGSPDGVHTPEELARYEKDVQEVMAAIYLLRAMPGDLDPEMTKDLRIAIGLFLKTPEGANKLSTVVSILPSSLKEFKRLLEETHLVNVSKIGISAIEFVKKYYRVY